MAKSQDKIYHYLLSQLKNKPKMNKTVKTILLIAGIALLGYGIYTLIAPEASVSLGGLSMEAQDNTNSYITIGLGIIALAVSFLGGRK